MVLDDHTADGGYATWSVENSWREREARFAEAAVVFSCEVSKRDNLYI
jgi:hypothetical protein